MSKNINTDFVITYNSPEERELAKMMFNDVFSALNSVFGEELVKGDYADTNDSIIINLDYNTEVESKYKSLKSAEKFIYKNDGKYRLIKDILPNLFNELNNQPIDKLLSFGFVLNNKTSDIIYSYKNKPSLGNSSFNTIYKDNKHIRSKSRIYICNDFITSENDDTIIPIKIELVLNELPID